MTESDSLCCCHYHALATVPHLSHYAPFDRHDFAFAHNSEETEAARHDYEMLLLPVMFALFEQNSNEHYEMIVQILIFTTTVWYLFDTREPSF
jgi:hypothetical protein